MNEISKINVSDNDVKKQNIEDCSKCKNIYTENCDTCNFAGYKVCYEEQVFGK